MRQEQTGYIEEKSFTRGGTGVGGTRLPRAWPSRMHDVRTPNKAGDPWSRWDAGEKERQQRQGGCPVTVLPS